MPNFTTSDNVAIAYTDWGSGKPIVFIHSWALNGDAWDYVVTDLLDSDVRCVTYDRRGHGGSDRVGRGYDFDRLAADLAELIECLDLRDVTLVGHSMGCGEITRYLTNHGDERIARVVFVAPLLPFVLQTDDNPTGVPQEYIHMSANLLRDDVPMWCANNAPPYFGVSPTVSAGMTDWTMRQIISTPVKILYDTMLLGATTDFRAELAKVSKPLLILHGDADASTPLAITGQPTAAIVNDAELMVYEGAGHGIYATHHREIATEIRRFS